MSSWKDPFVRAGVACPAFIKEKTGVYPAVFIRFRRPDPVTTERQLKEFSAAANDPEKVIESMQKFVSLFICEWNIEAPCDFEHIKKLTHAMLMRIYFVIVGQDSCGDIPQEFLGEGESGSSDGEQKKS